MIVTPEGLKVFPEDVEKTLNQIAGVRDSAVIGKDRVHAVLLLDAGRERRRDRSRSESAAWKIIRRSARSRCGPATIFRAPRPLANCVAPKSPKPSRKAEPRAAAPPANELPAILQKYAPGRTITPETTLDELGLSSLDRVQLLMDLEQKFESGIDERAFTSASTVADLAKPAPAAANREPELVKFPTYNRSWIARAARRVSQPLFLAAAHANLRPHSRVRPRESRIDSRPVIFASNHQSHFDVPSDSREPSAALALSRRDRDGEGILRRALLSRAFSAWSAIPDQPVLSPLDILFQRVPDSAAAGRRGRNHPLHG